MKQASGDAGGDRDQFPLPIEDFHARSAGEFRKVNRAAATDAGGRFIGGSNRGKLGQELARMYEDVVNRARLCSTFKIIQGTGFIHPEFAQAGAAEALEVSSAAEL